MTMIPNIKGLPNNTTIAGADSIIIETVAGATEQRTVSELLGTLPQSIPFTQNALTKEPTGFTDPSAVVVTYDPTSQKITLTGTVVAYYQGVDISVANPTFTSGWVSAGHPVTTGHVYFLYYNGTNFLWSDNSFPGFDKVLIAWVNYGATNKYAVRECHGFMPWQDHKEFHETIGTYKSAGGAFTALSYTLGSTTASARRPLIDETTLYDEDVPTINAALTTNSYTHYHLTGASVGTYTLASAEIIDLLSDNPYYNSFSTPNWGQTLMPSNSVATVWVYAVPVTSSVGSQAYRYLFVQPQWVTQATSGSSGNMTTATNTEALRLPSELNLGTLTTEIPELVCIGKIIIGFTTNWTLRAVTVLTGNKFSQIGSPSGNYLSTVATDGTLTGDGTGASPLSVTNTLTLPTTDAQCVGNHISSINSGYSSAVGDLVFYDTDSKWSIVDADAVATCNGLIGIALEAKTDGNAMKVALPGSFVHIDAWTLTAGDTMYAGETPGAIQNTIPTGANAIIRVVGFAIDADTLYFNPSSDQQSTVA